MLYYLTHEKNMYTHLGSFSLPFHARVIPVIQPLDIAVNRSLKNYLIQCTERKRLSQLKCNDISKNIYIKSPDRNVVLRTVLDFIKTDKTGYSGFKKIVTMIH